MYKSSWGWTLGRSKHIVDTIIKLKQKCKIVQFVDSYYTGITQRTVQENANFLPSSLPTFFFQTEFKQKKKPASLSAKSKVFHYGNFHTRSVSDEANWVHTTS